MKKAYSYKWTVQIKRGYFMAGIHRFETRKAAQDFVDKWLKANRGAIGLYADIPIVKKSDPDSKFITTL